ncbi:hypothetical protein ACJRO7_011084 [Eucalyptus globulus]|uniref:TIR domain-containing protein n=1 Tax=Eucalyptus globulus TaxID=34317 RepID=A0ABD3LHL7_EUCGL
MDSAEVIRDSWIWGVFGGTRGSFLDFIERHRSRSRREGDPRDCTDVWDLDCFKPTSSRTLKPITVISSLNISSSSRRASLSNFPTQIAIDKGRSHTETNERMHPLIMGRSPAVLAVTILFSMLAFNLLKKKKRASTPSFISPTPTGEGNVFLSFRGSDTRKGFADHLYHSLDKAGIVPAFVFRDDKSIPIGEEFGPRILDAIAWSKISIPIISQKYASSKWCLRELIHIMDRAKRTSHIVLPIFYKVNPSDVRHLKGSFGKAFHSHKKYFDEEDIQKGQQALEEVSYLHGWESEKVANGHEGELIERVVETIIRKLQEDFQLNVPPQLVGLDGPMKEIMNWIHSPSSINARMIGIYGMGGIGKTTLAKCIYNQLFNKFTHVSFLLDVRETIRQNGITYLQNQLILDILQSKWEVSRIDDGINIIQSKFRGKKVLILLDDIDDKIHLDALAKKRDWFMEESLIIVTTRNEAILDQSEFEVDYKYRLNELDEVRALLLFNRHAFRKDHSPRDFKGICGDIISTMGGLPLALQVVGSYLYKKNKKVWEDVRKQLKNQPHREVQNILRISYDALQDGHKQIFLDIVCFFIGIHKDGKDAQFAMYMWEGCGFYPNQGIEELKLRCLIKIGDDGIFKVHDQLRDLGRSIFCQGQPLEKHSGPWDDNYEGVPRVVRRLEVKYGTLFFYSPFYFNQFNLIYSNISWSGKRCSYFLGKKIYLNIHLCPS